MSITAKEAQAFLDETPLDELGVAFEVLVDRVFKHRMEHSGYVPLSIYPFLVGFGGVYPAVEIVVEAVDYHPYSEATQVGIAPVLPAQSSSEWRYTRSSKSGRRPAGLSFT